jgi:hypothetical protein
MMCNVSDPSISSVCPNTVKNNAMCYFALESSMFRSFFNTDLAWPNALLNDPMCWQCVASRCGTEVLIMTGII